MSKTRILVVDDERNAREALRTLLTDEGYEVAEAGDGEEGLALLQTFAPDVVLSDVRMPRMDGLALLKAAREQGHSAAFVMMTAFATVDLAVAAMKAGADQFLTKPLDVEAVLVVLGKVLEKRRLAADAESLRERVRARFAPDNIVGSSPELSAVFEVVHRAAPTKATVLILGESGTGKELVAQALHESSPRADKRFVKVNCAALAESLLESELFGHEKGSFTGAIGRREGRFELADGGTLFLDEVGEISPALQVKLLRVLQTREFERVGGTQTLKVDVRVVAATNRDLAAEVKAGRFREDLFYRLNVVSVTLPPLRRRKSDIPALAGHFVERFSKSYGKDIVGLAPAAVQQMMAYEWPGNVRELENVVERAVVLCTRRELGLDDLPPALRGARAATEASGAVGTPVEDVLRTATGRPLIPGATLYEIEKEAILRTLDMVGGSTSKAAEVLDISVRKIQYRLKEYGLGGRQGYRARPFGESDGDGVPEDDEPAPAHAVRA